MKNPVYEDLSGDKGLSDYQLEKVALVQIDAYQRVLLAYRANPNAVTLDALSTETEMLVDLLMDGQRYRHERMRL